MTSYLYFIKIRMLLSLAYRFETITTILVRIIFLTVTYFFWTAIYGGAGSSAIVSGASLDQMLMYSVISILMACLFSTRVESNLHDRIRKGNVAVDYIKPLSVFGMYFAEDIGEIIKNVVQKFIPLLIFASLFLVKPVPYSFLYFSLFLISVIFSFLILWFIAAIFGLLHFWLTDLGPLGLVKDYIIGFLSGSLIPTWFFPEQVQRILSYMPFVYIYQYPISIFLGKISYRDALMSLLIQFVWCGIFFALFQFMNKKAARNLMVQGG